MENLGERYDRQCSAGQLGPQVGGRSAGLSSFWMESRSKLHEGGKSMFRSNYTLLDILEAGTTFFCVGLPSTTSGMRVTWCKGETKEDSWLAIDSAKV